MGSDTTFTPRKKLFAENKKGIFITIIYTLTCHKGKAGTFAQCDSFFNGQDRQYFCDTCMHNISAKFYQFLKYT